LSRGKTEGEKLKFQEVLLFRIKKMLERGSKNASCLFEGSGKLTN